MIQGLLEQWTSIKRKMNNGGKMKKYQILKSQEGATAVEFAIVLLLLIFFLFGIIEFSIILYNKAMLTNASREGARAAVLFSWPNRISADDIETKVWKEFYKKDIITFDEQPKLIDPDPDVVPYPCEDKQGELITVRIQYNYDFLFLPFAQIPLNVQSVVRCE
jgi:hypothetical protein